MNQAMLSELFGGEARLKLIQALYLSPNRQFTGPELASETAVDRAAANRWLRRWAVLGLIERDVDGRNIRYRASSDPALSGLTDLIVASHGILDDIRQALPAAVDVAVVFGSRARGEERAESDVDVLVLGEDLSSIAVNAALKPVSRKHRRDINASTYSTAEFRQLVKEGDSFAVNVLAEKTIPLKGNLHDAISQTEGAREG